MRGNFRTDADGSYHFRTVRPLGYSIPMDGPVGEMVRQQKRHGMRPSHIHCLIGAEGYRELVTALYFGDDPNIDSATRCSACRSRWWWMRRRIRPRPIPGLRAVHYDFRLAKAAPGESGRVGADPTEADEGGGVMPRRLVDISSPLKAGSRAIRRICCRRSSIWTITRPPRRWRNTWASGSISFRTANMRAVERVEISTHNGTHMDAPYHFFSSMNHALKPGGEPSWRIDDVPLDWCFQPGVKLDFRHLPDGYVATPGDVEAELKRIGHDLRPLEIVVVNTAAGARYGQDDFVDTGCGMGKAATMWLLERGVRVVGTDGWSWDAPFSFTRREGEGDRRRQPDLGGPSRRARDRLFPDGKAGQSGPAAGGWFRIVCFPVKVHRASAGWTRAVAIIDEQDG